ncbi:lipocalin family protein [Flavobacterium sp. MXW15]|uniref:Outer membrane lipoprotein Blc n=1 Tax=Xanthomonas chitinilytica TaxID=2989819 RepID=A0ABT3JWM7_9XANT|nr:lipocalin family protein [Xanthomonas sp. H13-6]MCW4455663.1 lipocalin family protein [Flavobacterium sp. MXW15]MCW4472851.1 lipocalin family protein [Xanthomonas sp. H13-6]
MTAPTPLTTVASLDLPRYLGTWYEIARLPMRHEPAGCTDVSATYTRQDDGTVQIRNRCRDHGGLQESVGEATPVDGDNARLEVSFLPQGLRWIPFTKGDYWVIQVDAGYSVALVGSPDRQHLWLLARQPQLDEMVQRHYLACAVQQGFDLAGLIHTPHTGKPTA